MKEKLLKRKWDTEDRIQFLKGEVYKLLSQMYHDPEKALDHAIETAGDPMKGIEGTIDALNKSARDFGTPQFPRVGKESREKVIRFKENRTELIRVLRDLDYEQGKLGHIKSGLEEIERTENQDTVKEAPKGPEKTSEKQKADPEYKEEREFAEAEKDKEAPEYPVEREANSSTRNSRRDDDEKQAVKAATVVSPKYPPREKPQEKTEEELEREKWRKKAEEALKEHDRDDGERDR